jgi:hypothetical protein
MTAPGGSLGSAVVSIVADVRRFARSVRASVASAFGGRGRGSIYYSSSYAGRQAGDAFATRFAQGVAGGFQRAGRGLAKIFTGLLSPAALMTGTKILGIVAGLKQIILLGPALAGVGQSLAALGALLPALAITGVLVSKTLSTAFKGVGEAMKAAAEGDAAALEEAIKDLSPAAQAFVREVAKIAPAWEKVGKAVQESFFAPFRGAFSELANPSVLAALQTAMSGIAGALGRAAAGVAKVIGAAGRSGQLARIFSPLTRAVERITVLAPSMTKAFLGLAEVAAPVVESLSKVLAGKLGGVIDKINAAVASGEMKEFFENAVDAVVAFGSVLADIGRIFSAVMGGLNVEGNSAIGTIGVLIDTLANFLESAEGLEALNAIGVVISQLGGLLGAVVTPLLKPLATLVTIIGTNLALALKFLMPAITLLAEAFGGLLQPVMEALGPIFKDLVTNVAGPLASAIITLAEHIRIMTPTAVEMLKIMGPGMHAAFEALGEVLVALLPFWEELAEILQNNTWLFRLIAGLLTAVLYILSGSLYILEAVITLWGKFASFMKDEVWTEFPGVMSLIGGAAFGLLQALVGPIDSIGELWDVVVSGGEKVLAFLGGIPARIAGFGAAFYNAAASLGGQIGKGFAQIGNFAADIGGKIYGTIKNGINGIIRGINNGIGQLDAIIPGSLGRLPFFARGGIIDEPTIGVMGEGGRREVVLPLTDPARSAQLAQQSGLMDVLRAGGLGGGVPVINITAILDGFGVLKVVDQRVEAGMNKQGRELAFGGRGI